MRRALLIGINYANDRANALAGCINDAQYLRQYLMSRGYAERNIVTLLETQATREGILRALFAECALAAKNRVEHLFISYSGHGSQVRDKGGEERDGKDEVLVGYDSGLVSDDLICAALTLLPPTTRVFLLIDACHSGSAADIHPGLRCHAVQISGCRDDQLSSDAFGLVADRAFSGAMTAGFLEFARPRPAEFDAEALRAHLHSYLSARGFPQRPEVSASRGTDVRL